MQHKRPRGTLDILPSYLAEQEWISSELWNHVELMLKNSAFLWGFSELRTPMFEHSELFEKIEPDGEYGSISKEMYQLTDKKGRKLSLRPEGTPASLRAIGEGGGFDSGNNFRKCHRVYYLGPMFRYERPQSGRYRQFNQFGVEVLGTDCPRTDCDVILLANHILQSLGISHKIKLNSLGDKEDIKSYKRVLVSYFTKYSDSLSKDSKSRLHKNPLRILDSKDSKDITISSEAPSSYESLSETSKAKFDKVCEILSAMGIQFEIDASLVRGLDYYTNTVFEFVDNNETGNSILGGGRYNTLVKELGFTDRSGIGFAIGLERLIQTFVSSGNYKKRKYDFDVLMICISDIAYFSASSLTQKLRENGLSVVIEAEEKNLSNAMRLVNILNVKWAVIIGQREHESGTVSIKNTSTRVSKSVSIQTAIEYLLKNDEDSSL